MITKKSVRLISVILSVLLVFSLCTVLFTACSNKTNENIIGISMPTKDLQRWNQDGENLKSQLENAGYKADLQYASGEIDKQVAQIETFVNEGCKVIIIAAVDGDSLGTVVDMAAEKQIEIIAYDRLIMNTSHVSYYATFDNYSVGKMQGSFIEEKLNLSGATQPYNMEIVAGDIGDNNSRIFYNGAMDVLQKYIDKGVLNVKSGQIDFNKVTTPSWSTEQAQARFDSIIASSYSDGSQIDAVLCSSDCLSLGVINSLETNYTGKWPIITGQDCDIINSRYILSDKQSMSIFKDTRTLANISVEMVKSILNGEEPPVNDTTSYNNGAITVSSYLCTPVVVTKENVDSVLIDSGYYTRNDLYGTGEQQ